jgi:hypothetical protein
MQLCILEQTVAASPGNVDAKEGLYENYGKR